jgi:predicted DNA-binding protein with PD1-like motif
VHGGEGRLWYIPSAEKEIAVKTKLLHEHDQKTFALVFDTGDEVISELLAFAKKHHLAGSHFNALGAFSDVTVGYFDWEAKEYKRIPLDEQVEVLSFVGDIALNEGEPKVHAHAVVGKADGTAHGGHVLEAHVRPTLEVILVESPQHLQRKTDPETGLALIRL